MRPDPDLTAIDRALDAPPNPPAEEMTMRDAFAGQAMVGALSNHNLLLRIDEEFSYLSTREAVSAYAYAVADAMLRERTKGPR